ncbi:YifB family Mg chelatase-like AAA ATPase [Mycetocola spongiae]|uniref:YifB family Mg chelatase-like AAA ATPase n=1 Tax=Mycetocola spongiae TaxID=2859226 RepID=UPI001CF1A8B5|nr:YifB family Mg chelatase-like AAA ATPase [Mycetocola spongiae]UCR89207.1 YifB family Mg chelatase-like AAA ATPase [Mycetocola spongiae]
MSVGRTWAVALVGIEGELVEVEADISQSLPRLVIIGLVDRSLGEAEGRVRLAASNSGCRLPTGRITVNLSPASRPKAGSGFDLAIALACLAADARVSASSVDGVVHIGELGLDGRLRPTVGVLPAVMSACRAGRTTIMVPEANRAEAELVPEARVIAVGSLREAALWHGAELRPPEEEEPAAGAAAREREAEAVPGAAGPERSAPEAPPPDIADVLGQDDALESLIVAAAGGHHLALVGPPGAGKSMLAARLPGLLPDLSVGDALEVAAVHSLAGITLGRVVSRRPPWEAPHHSATAAAIIGGGSGLIRPGAAARAVHGVLFLDEAAEFTAHVLDALRQPIEDGRIVIHRAVGVATFPGSFQLVLASNPCPCGRFGEPDHSCTCPAQAIRKYQARISGPLLDRVDIRIRVRPLSLTALRLAREPHPREHTLEARERVGEARARCRHRLRDTRWHTNAQVPGAWLRSPGQALPLPSVQVLDEALGRGRLSMRGYDRVLRMSWTLADLAGAPRPTAAHIARALYLREGTTL